MFEQKVLATIQKHNMVEENDKVLVAVSGGPDSVALLNVLLTLKPRFNLKLHVFHLNHRMRGTASEKDAVFVKDLATKMKLPVTIVSYDVPQYIRENKLSPEEGAREVRYMLLKKTAKEVKANKIALGHSQDDQVETFLMRIVKGAGKEGLGSIPPVRGSLVRPLIEVKRAEVEEYLRGNQLEFQIDVSNDDLNLLRNKIRLKLLPSLRQYNSNFDEVVIRTVDIIREEEEVLQSLVDRKYRQIVRETDRLVKFPLSEFKTLSLAIRRRLLRRAIAEVKGDIRRIEFKHIEAILDALVLRKGKVRFDLPGCVVVFSEYDNIVVAKEDELEGRQVAKTQLQVPGFTYLSQLGVGIGAEFKDKKDLQGISQNKLAYLDADRVELPVFVRTSLPGDKFRPLGMKGTKKLQDFFVDEKIPLRIRNKVPIVLSKEKIVWVAGMRIDDQFKVTDETEKVLVLERRFD